MGSFIWPIKEAQSFPEKYICCDQSSIVASSLLPHVFTQFGGAPPKRWCEQKENRRQSEMISVLIVIVLIVLFAII